MRKIFFVFLTILLIDVSLSLMTNADILDSQKQYLSLENSLEEAKEKKAQLFDKVLKLSSLKRISETARELNLVSGEEKLVFVLSEKFAMR